MTISVASAIVPADEPAAIIGIIMYCAAPANTKRLANTANHPSPPAWTNRKPNTVPSGMYPMATGAVSASAENRVTAGSNPVSVLFVTIEAGREQQAASHCAPFASSDEPAVSRRQRWKRK